MQLKHTCLVVLVLLLLPATALAAGATVNLSPPPAAVAAGAEFTTDVAIQGADAVLGFQFDVLYDANLVELSDFDLGSWLGSTGRSPAKLGPALAKEGGRATIGAYTLGQQPGAGGDGLMVTLRWKAKANGNAGNLELQLQKLQLAGAGGAALPGDIGAGKINVTIGNAAAGASSESSGGSNTQTLILSAGLFLVAVIAFFLLRQRRA